MKQNRGLIIFIVGIVIAAIIALLFLVDWDRSEDLNWNETYTKQQRIKLEPYGLQLLSEMIGKTAKDVTYLNEQDRIRRFFNGKEERGTYMFIGKNMYLTDEDIDTLLIWIEKGNEAFISSRGISNYLMNSILDDDYYYWDGYGVLPARSSTVLSFNDGSEYNYTYYDRGDTAIRTWTYIRTVDYGELFEQLGYIHGNFEKFPNFIGVNYGKGKIFVHSTPLVFTNYYFKTEEGFEYVDRVFSHLEMENVILDNVSDIPASLFQDINIGDIGSKPQKGPLDFILRHRSLRLAWYMVIVMVFFFLIFRVRRRQNLIPVTEKNVNTSLEFTKTVGRLYYKQKSHYKLGLMQRQLFFLSVNEKYGIQTNRPEEELTEIISRKTKLPKTDIEKIFSSFKLLDKRGTMTSDELIVIYQALQKYYQNINTQ